MTTQIKRFRKLYERIAAQPDKTIDMEYWATIDRHLYLTVGAFIEARAARPECGTTLCLAGHAAVLYAEESTAPCHGGFQEVALRYLGLTFPQGVLLFFRANWPNEAAQMSDKEGALYVINRAIEALEQGSFS